jgi:hypothetical protein
MGPRPKPCLVYRLGSSRLASLGTGRAGLPILLLQQYVYVTVHCHDGGPAELDQLGSNGPGLI